MANPQPDADNDYAQLFNVEDSLQHQPLQVAGLSAVAATGAPIGSLMRPSTLTATSSVLPSAVGVPRVRHLDDAQEQRARRPRLAATANEANHQHDQFWQQQNAAAVAQLVLTSDQNTTSAIVDQALGKARVPAHLAREVRKQGEALEKSARPLLKLQKLSKLKLAQVQAADEGKWPSGARKPKLSTVFPEHAEAVPAELEVHSLSFAGLNFEQAIERLAPFGVRTRLALEQAIITRQIGAVTQEVTLEAFKAKCTASSTDKAKDIELAEHYYHYYQYKRHLQLIKCPASLSDPVGN